MNRSEEQNSVEDVVSLVREIHEILRRHRPAVQGLALSELVGSWLASHSLEVRNELLAMHLSAVKECINEIDPPRKQ